MEGNRDKASLLTKRQKGSADPLAERKKDRVNLLTIPGLVIVIVVTQVPFAVTICLSLVNWNIRRPDLPISFAGLANFSYVLTSSDFFTAVGNTFVITLGALAIAAVLGFALALAFSRKFPGITIARSLLVMPFFVMEPVIGIVWKTLILSPTFGLTAVFFQAVGMAPVSFLGAANARLTIIALCAWQWTPFLFLILLSGLQGLSEDVLESAKLDGAGWWRLIWHFKIPLTMPYFKVAGMYGLINLLKVFGIIYVTTQGGPGVASANLPYYVYRTGFYEWQAGRAAAVSVLMVVLILIGINVFFRFQGNPLRRGA